MTENDQIVLFIHTLASVACHVGGTLRMDRDRHDWDIDIYGDEHGVRMYWCEASGQELHATLVLACRDLIERHGWLEVQKMMGMEAVEQLKELT